MQYGVGYGIILGMFAKGTVSHVTVAPVTFLHHDLSA